MTEKQGRTRKIDVQGLLDGEGDYVRSMVSSIVEATLEAEMTAALGAEKGERTASRLGYRSGYYPRSLVTRVGALAEMYVRGVSTRKVKAITEELCGPSFPASRSARSTRSWTGNWRRLPAGGSGSPIPI